MVMNSLRKPNPNPIMDLEWQLMKELDTIDHVAGLIT